MTNSSEEEGKKGDQASIFSMYSTSVQSTDALKSQLDLVRPQRRSFTAHDLVRALTGLH